MGKNNSKKLANLLIVDPNPCDMGSIPLENLNIEVELKVYPREDDIIIHNINKKTTELGSARDNSEKFTTLSFINNNGKEDYLTTHYTELGTKFNTDNPDLETLGIESIDISFNTSYVPIVKIRFKDIRGKLFEQGNDSPYSFLFKMPYPIFYLTVKGYYGKPVTYALHMTKFSGSLDSESGSFIINCDFIGYTYAFLTDILMGYIKAIPYTNIGSKLISDNFTTIDDLLLNINNLEKSIESYKNNDKKLASLTIFTDLIVKLERIDKYIDDTINKYKSTSNGEVLKTSKISGSKKVEFLRKELNKNDIIFYEESILNEIKNYIDYVETKKINKYILNEDDFKLDSNGVYYDKLDINTLIDTTITPNEPINWVVYKSNAENTNKIENFITINNNNAIEENLKIIESYTDFQNLLLSDEFKSSSAPLYVFDFRNVSKIISNLKLEINEELKLIKKEVINEFIVKIGDDLKEKGVDFDPSIGYFFKVLSGHVDLFLDSIKKVSEDVKKLELTGDRKLSKMLDGKFPEAPDNDDYHIKAFPEYLELDDDSKTYTDKWIGNNVKFMNSPEVIFINDFYEAILKRGKIDKDFIKNNGINESGWIPINPFDSKIINKSLNNPWGLIGNSSEEVIYKLLIQRMVTFLGYSNKNLLPQEISDMAKIEAEQSFNAIINDIVKITMVPNDIDLADTSENSELNKRINLINDSNIENYGLSYLGDEIITNGYIFNGKNNVSNSYTDESGNLVTIPIQKTYLPITQTNEQLKSEQNPFLTPENRLTSDEIFSSRLVMGDDDNGETFIKILDKREYKNDLPYENYDNLLTNKPNNKNTRLTTNFKSVDTKINEHNYILGGIFGTHEFMTYQSKDGDIDSFYEFYEKGNEIIKGNRKSNESSDKKYDTYLSETFYNPNVTTCHNKKNVKELKSFSNSFESLKQVFIDHSTSKNKNITFKFEPTFTGPNDIYSLFGSDFYNSQDSNIAKAFLFLHTIPYEGMGEITNATSRDRTRNINTLDDISDFGIFNSKIKTFFNQRAGMVEVPHSWALFIGSLLHRASNNIDIIKFNEGGYDLVNGFTKHSIINTTDYLNNYITSVGRFSKVVNIGSNNLSFREGGIESRSLGISKILLNLPKSVKKEFINLFLNWVDNDSGFKKLQSELEIFTDTSISVRTGIYNSLASNVSANILLKDNAPKNYSVISPYSGEAILTQHKGGTPVDFFLELRDGGTATNLLIKFLNETKVIVNGTYRIWEENVDDYLDIKISKNQANYYLTEYLKHFRDLNRNLKIGEEKDDISRYVFNSTNVDDIKLKLYKNVKSINDKWVVGVDGTNSDIMLTDIFSRFTFIDRSYTDISNLFKMSPTGMAKTIVESTNVNFYNFIARILVDNNFDFIPLPTFTNYNDPEEVSNIFEPQRFNESSPTDGPQFICMYIGERSNKLDIQEKHGINKNDGWRVNTTCNNGVLDANDSSTLPNDYLEGTSSIPYFLVKYADQNQSLFKSIKVDQMEFTETDEGLQIIEDLGNKNRNNSVGQNLFDIYQNRSYSAEVDMLGCAQIQPFMYFQLDNIPMFTGAYTIINTRHSIKPNHMTTTFKGVRIRYGKTKMVDYQTLYLNLIGNLADVSNEGVFYNDSQTEYVSKVRFSKEDDRDIIDAKDVNSNIAGTFSNPLNEMIITSQFGVERSFAPGKPHQGVDYRAKVGTPFYAVTSMKLVRIRYEKNKVGNVNGGLYLDFKVEGQDLWIRYMHLSQLTNKVFDGVTISEGMDMTSGYPIGHIFKQNDLIGATGDTGGADPHLHFDIRTSQGSVSGIKYKKDPNLFFKSTTDKFAKTQDNELSN